MGSSQSDDSTRSRRSTTATTNPKMKMSSYHMGPEQAKRLMKWSKVFNDLMSSDKYEEVPQWTAIKLALIQQAKKVPKDINIDSIYGLQFGSLASTRCFSQYADELEVSPTNVRQFSQDEIAPMRTSIQSTSEFGENDERKNVICHSTVSVQVRASNFFLSFTDKPSVRHDLKRALLSQLENPKQIIHGLLSTFKLTCQEQFGKSVEKLDMENYTAEHKGLLAALVSVIKRFVSVLTKFLGWIYKDLLQHFEQSLEKEELKPADVMEDALYEVLFKGKESNIYSLVFKLMSVKYRNEMMKFKQVLAQNKEKVLLNYDEVLQRSKEFLLENSPAPYETAIQKIRSIQKETNPYNKCEIVKALQEEMWNCVCQYYNKEDPEMISKLRGSFGMDLQMPIMTYCVIQSQCEDLIIQAKMIEEFVDSDILDFSIGFTVFKGAIEFFLQEGSHRSLSESVHSTLSSFYSRKNGPSIRK